MGAVDTVSAPGQTSVPAILDGLPPRIVVNSAVSGWGIVIQPAALGAIMRMIAFVVGTLDLVLSIVVMPVR